MKWPNDTLIKDLIYDARGLECSFITLQALVNANIKTVGQLRTMTDSELLALWQIGRRSVLQLREEFGRHGQT